MSDNPTLRALEVDLTTNTLRLALADAHAPVDRATEDATIDIGTGGRLVGVELPALYIDVMPPEPGTEHLIRSASAAIEVEREQGGGAVTALVIPRLGAGYEITYPSGNQ